MWSTIGCSQSARRPRQQERILPHQFVYIVCSSEYSFITVFSDNFIKEKNRYNVENNLWLKHWKVNICNRDKFFLLWNSLTRYLVCRTYVCWNQGGRNHAPPRDTVQRLAATHQPHDSGSNNCHWAHHDDQQHHTVHLHWHAVHHHSTCVSSQKTRFMFF